jgi:hypothetical protein
VVVVVVVHVEKRSCQANKQIQNHRNVTTQTRIHQQKSCQNNGCDLAIYIKKVVRQKKNSWKLKSFMMQNYNLEKKNPLKETKILQDIIITL